MHRWEHPPLLFKHPFMSSHECLLEWDRIVPGMPKNGMNGNVEMVFGTIHHKLLYVYYIFLLYMSYSSYLRKSKHSFLPNWCKYLDMVHAHCSMHIHLYQHSSHFHWFSCIHHCIHTCEFPVYWYILDHTLHCLPSIRQRLRKDNIVDDQSNFIRIDFL